MKSVLDSRQLLAASVLAKTGSFTLAGKELYLTQSAVSHAIRALEEDLECQLFARTGRGVVLTPAGARLLRYAEPILEKMQAARTEMAQAAGIGAPQLRIGGSPQTTQFVLPAVLAQFKEQFPRHAVWNQTADQAWQVQALRDEQLDLAFIFRPTDQTDLTFSPLVEEEMRVIVAAEHPWALLGRVPVPAAGQPNLMLYTKAHQVPAPMTGRDNPDATSWVELPTVEAIKDMIRTGLAAGLLVPWAVQEELADGRFVALPAGRGALVRQWGVAHLKGRPLSVAEEKFIDLCRAAVLELNARLRAKAGGYKSKPKGEAKKNEVGGLMGDALSRTASSVACFLCGASITGESLASAWLAAG